MLKVLVVILLFPVLLLNTQLVQDVHLPPSTHKAGVLHLHGLSLHLAHHFYFTGQCSAPTLPALPVPLLPARLQLQAQLYTVHIWQPPQ